MQEKGFDVENYRFKDLQNVQAKLANYMMSTKGLLRYDVKAKKLVYRDQKTEKQLGDFFKIIAEELSFTKPEQMEKLFKSNPDRALDFVAK